MTDGMTDGMAGHGRRAWQTSMACTDERPFVYIYHPSSQRKKRKKPKIKK